LLRITGITKEHVEARCDDAICNPSTQEAEARGQPGLYNNILKLCVIHFENKFYFIVEKVKHS
jgi:hypothetical protein